jgi:purine-binding chemotaxis protein CheW
MELELSVPPDIRELNDAVETTRSKSSEDQRFITFYIGETLYAIPTVLVAEVGPKLSATTLPDTPLYVPGITSHRGEVLVIIDLRNGAGELTASQNPKVRSMILRKFDGESMQAAFNVDRVCEIRTASVHSITANNNELQSLSIDGLGNARLISASFLDNLLTKTLDI